MRVTGLDSWTGSPSASFASSAPKPMRQKASVSRSADLEKSTAEISFRSLLQPNGPRTNSTVCCQSSRSFGSACEQGTSTLPRAPSVIARFERTSALRKSSSSPSRALRRPIRTFWPGGAW